MLKSMRKSKNRYFYHIFVSAGDALGAITLNVVWMKENSMLTNCLAACTHLSSTVSQLFEPQVQKKSPFSRNAAHIFVSPGDAPAIITQHVAWMENNSMLAKRLTACTHLSSTVSELYDA